MSQSPSTPDQGSAPAGGEPKGPFGKVLLFLRQVIDELKKVVVPTRRELVNYTTVVLVFVLVVIGIVTGFDAVFSRGAEALFGGDSGGVEQPAEQPAEAPADGGGAGGDGAVDDSAENGD
ncbi:preprotein translocase subunit SecE [Nesterenkonia sp. Act20]|uniref:preprotein translocase subunit SecE n=1 Tax=Nesterenkonia sp. Act20 TaxID=1483432 RepID=UPI00350E366C